MGLPLTRRGAFAALAAPVALAGAAAARPVCLAPDEQALLDATNAVRAAAGVPPLAAHRRLQALARWKAGELARHDLLSHTLPDGTGPAEHFALFGLAGVDAAENASVAEHWLGANWETNLAKLLGSPPHLENMLRPELTHAGMASAMGASGLYTVQEFARLAPAA